MAVDEAVFRAAQKGDAPPTLRFYGWRRPTVSIGYFQDPCRDISLATCRAEGIEIVRRPTGGRAVLHEGDLTYSVVARADDPLFSTDILSTYRVISACLAEGLRRLGVPAEMAPEGRVAESGPGPAPCFALPSRFELIVDGKKICGSAQGRSRGAFLQHGSLLLTFDAERMARFLTGPRASREGQARALEASVTCLGRHLSPLPGTEGLCRVLREAFAQTWEVEFVEGGLSAQERALAEKLRAEKYGCDAWNLRTPRRLPNRKSRTPAGL